jgi:hypothetical protein
MKTFQVAGLLALIFVAGLVVGGVATDILEQRGMRQAVDEAIAHPTATRTNIEMNIDLRLDKRLNLGPGQHMQVRRILKDAREKMRAAREEYQPRLNAIALDARSNIYAVLKPNQQEAFAAFLEDNRQFLMVRELPPRQNNPSLERTNSPAPH